MNRIRILLVEPVLEDARFLEEAFAEAQELRIHGDWTAFQITPVENVEDARDVAAEGATDLIVLDPDPQRGILPEFLFLQESLPSIPTIVLLNRGDESAAPSLLRAGAQDCLVKEDLDCAPLARAIHHALYRQRLLNAWRRTAAFDAWTGLYNERGFFTMGSRELHLAAITGQSILLTLAALDPRPDTPAPWTREQRDLALLEASEVLRAATGSDSLLACLDGRRFAILLWNTPPERLFAAVDDGFTAAPRDFRFRFGWTIASPDPGNSLDVLLAAAETGLCENKQSSPITSDASPLTLPTRSATTSQA